MFGLTQFTLSVALSIPLSMLITPNHVQDAPQPHSTWYTDTLTLGWSSANLTTSQLIKPLLAFELVAISVLT